MQEVRRVVTGHSPEGKAVFVSDETVAAAPMGQGSAGGFNQLWGGDVAPTFPDDGRPPAQATFFPPVGGDRFGVVTMPPAGPSRPPEGDREAIGAEMERRFPGLAAHMERDNPGMHT